MPRLHAPDLRHVGDVGAEPAVEHEREVDQVAPRHVLAHVRLGEVERRVGAAHVRVGVEQQPQPEVALVPLLRDALPLAHLLRVRVRFRVRVGVRVRVRVWVSPHGRRRRCSAGWA